MNINGAKIIVLLAAGLAVIPIPGYSFSSGSDGSWGPINFSNNSTTPLTNTLAVPPNGIFNCTTISIGTNCYVNFVANALNTPIYMLAESNILISGTVDVSGQPGLTNGSLPTISGPGGFCGGAGGTPTAAIPAGAGQGPGYGSGGPTIANGGAFGTGGYNNTNTYGNLLLAPLLGGSGGGGIEGSGNNFLGASGGAGGGAILLASTTGVTINGNILAKGGSGCDTGGVSGGGSGGGVRIVSPLVSVTGNIDVSGGTNAGIPYYYYGGNGRVRIDTISTINAKIVGNSYAGAPIVSYGRSLFVFPSTPPQLYFLGAAGTTISAGATNSVAITLPSGSATNQMVTLFGSNFLGTVPVEVVATPVTGTPFTTNIVLNFPTTNSYVQTNIVISVPPGVPTQLNAYANYYVQP